MGQVRHHQESTERQYALKHKALELGWTPSLIRILDRDLGKSGAHASGRKDFKTLVADVSMGEVGALFCLEASRLARSNLDWQRLLELCALTETIVIDEDGCYDPSNFNDGLLLGLKGTIAQAELHFIRARLQGGKINKAKKGELRFPLPVGYCYDDQGQIVIDPDQEIQGAVRMIFDLFHKTGSTYGVVQEFSRQGLLFPKRAYGGVWNGKAIWDRLSDARVGNIIKNPSYAGVYTYGKQKSIKVITPDGEVKSRTKTMPMDEWLVTIKNHHEGYITYDDFVKNKKILEKNRTNKEDSILSGPAREGMALLQGLLVCGGCPEKIVDKVRKLSQTSQDDQIANTLNNEGHLSATGKSFNISMIKWIRYKHHIPVYNPKRADELTVREVSEKFGVSPHVVYYWINNGVVKARQQKKGRPHWLTIDCQKQKELSQWIQNSSRITKTEIVKK